MTVCTEATPDVSICIVNWNRADCLRTCLRSIEDGAPQVSLEIIVVDNASCDESVPLVRAEAPKVLLILNDTNIGFARANNQAFALARGRYLLLLNNDTIMMPGTLDAMVAFMEQHADAGILGCKVLNPDGSLQPSCRSFPSLLTLLWRAIYLDKLFPTSRLTGVEAMSAWKHDSSREVDVVKGCCMMVRRAMLEQVGSLDERFFMYFEEVDWCYRARQCGWKVHFTPEAQIVHLAGQSATLNSATMAVAYHQSRIEYFRKHHGWLAATWVWFMGMLELSSRLTYWSLSSSLRPQSRQLAKRKLDMYWPAWRWLVTRRYPATSR
jgi:hypothetical protein